MQICGQLTSDRPLALALGGFDGIHLGHVQVLRAVTDTAWTPAVFTFRDLIPAVKHTRQLVSARQQADQLTDLGIARLYLADFAQLHALTPEAFVREILHERLRARRVACGFNYRFGCHGAGDSDALKRLCATYGIETIVVPPVLLDGAPVSSTRIRTAVAAGEMELAARMLGRPYRIDFEVVHGRALGRTIGLPTINQPFPEAFVLPKFGVYAAAVTIDGRSYHAVTNIGVKPTVGADGPLAETCIAGYHGDLYGKCVPVQLLRFLRPEQKFDSIERLRSQIVRDADTAERVLTALRETKESDKI